MRRILMYVSHTNSKKIYKTKHNTAKSSSLIYVTHLAKPGTILHFLKLRFLYYDVLHA